LEDLEPLEQSSSYLEPLNERTVEQRFLLNPGATGRLELLVLVERARISSDIEPLNL
jgi:hypothetical protein